MTAGDLCLWPTSLRVLSSPLDRTSVKEKAHSRPVELRWTANYNCALQHSTMQSGEHLCMIFVELVRFLPPGKPR